MTRRPQPISQAPDPRTLNKADRAYVVEKLRARHRDDLADLYEHCPTFYPSYSIPPSDVGAVNLRPQTVGTMSSPAGLCFEN